MEQQVGTKRHTIMNAAIVVFSQMGYHSSRVTDITKKANVAYGLFYHYFHSKDEILINIFQESWKNLLEGIDEIDKVYDNPVDKIKAVVKYSLRNYENYPELLKVLIMDVPRLEKFYEKDNQKLYNAYFKKISQIISKGQDEGCICRDTNPSVISYIILGSIDSVIRQYVYNSGVKKNLVSMSKIADQVIRVLLDGIL